MDCCFIFLWRNHGPYIQVDVYSELDHASLNNGTQQVCVQVDDIMYEKHYNRSYTGGMDSRQIGHWRRSLIQLSKHAVWKM